MKILVVLPRFPYPLEKGDKLRAYHQLRMLARRNEIYLFCLSHDDVADEAIAAVKPFCKEVEVTRIPRLTAYKNVVRNFFGCKSLQLGYWDARSARKVYKQMERRVRPDVIYSQMVRTMPMVARSEVPKVMDFQDALSMNAERRMAEAKGLKHFVLHFEFKMLRSTEYNAFSFFDGLTIISEPDSEAIPHRKNGTIAIVPNGVDIDYYQPQPDARKNYDVVFCGNMQYEPNVVASKYLVEQVMPLVWQRFPEAQVLLAGASPKRSVKALAGERVTVSGWVDDMRQSYAHSRVFVAPMQLGSGLQNKLLEAMAMGLPCVTTDIANASLGAAEGSEILVGTCAQQLADHIASLLGSEERRNTLAQNGLNFVRNTYSWEAFGDKLEQVLAEAASKPSKVSLYEGKKIVPEGGKQR